MSSRLLMIMVLAGLAAMHFAMKAEAMQAPLSPSLAVQAIHRDLRNAPQSEQANILTRYQSSMPSRDTDRIEYFSWGEYQFLAFRPREAREVFQSFLDGEDWLSRIAWQRTMQMEIAAYQRPESARAMMEDFNRRFGYSTHDFLGSAQVVGNLARGHRDQGDHESAARLLIEHVRAAPFDGPYAIHTLPVTYLESFRAAGLFQEAVALMRSSRDGLSYALQARLSRGPTQEEEAGPALPEQVREWFMEWQTWRSAPSAFEAKNNRYRSAIQRLESALAAAQALP